MFLLGILAISFMPERAEQNPPENRWLWWLQNHVAPFKTPSCVFIRQYRESLMICVILKCLITDVSMLCIVTDHCKKSSNLYSNRLPEQSCISLNPFSARQYLNSLMNPGLCIQQLLPFLSMDLVM